MEITLEFKMVIVPSEENVQGLMKELGVTEPLQIADAVAKAFTESLVDDSMEGVTLELLSVQVAQ